mgnify:CR=1 FL=1
MNGKPTSAEIFGALLVLAGIGFGLWGANAWIDSRMSRNAWECIHHPPHVAFTPDEIAAATSKYGCEKWRVAK